ncbi:MAG TPA: NAD(P)-dependent alcohol dehydrogenase [Edaphobacter sp.]
MIATKGYAAQSATTPIAPFNYEHREPGDNDVLIDIMFCGICHSDIHQARNEWGGSLYPMVPGHEIVGKVSRVGSKVTKFKVGDLAAIGCMVDSCRECNSCKDGEEQYCDRGQTVVTYNGRDKNGNLTFGGYGNHIVADEAFVLSVPANLDPAAAAPLLCAGITTYSPLKHWDVGPGKKVGIVGLGGLGHMGLKFSHAFGAQTVLFTTSASKIEDAKRLGADEVILTREEGWADKHKGSFDFILDCVSAEHDLNTYLSLLKRDGTLCLVGVPEKPAAVAAFSVIMGRKRLSGSAIGGIKETQEMLDFCGEHNIVSDIEMTTYDKVNEAWDRVVKSDVKYRFVLDAKSL